MFAITEQLEGRLTDMICAKTTEYRRKRLWAIILGLTVRLDGDSYYVLWGDNLQEGIAGFGRSPEEALYDFDNSMEKKIRVKKHEQSRNP